MRAYIETYGCAAAQSDGEIISGILSRKGFRFVDLDKADTIIIVTCDVKAVTEQKITERIKTLYKKYPRKKFVLVGCMVDNRINKLKDIVPSASFVGTHRITEIEKIIECSGICLLGKGKKQKICLPRIRKNKNIGIVQISEGCRGACTFCSTRLAKGTIRSYSMENILNDISFLVKDGCKKIYLTSQDTGAYGYDIEDRCMLPDLLEKISSIKGKFKVRVGMMNPNNIIFCLPELIKAYRHDKIMKFIHIPVQSGSNEILRMMNRNYTVEDFKKIVSAFRKEYPKIIVWTDVIVGYPGETEKQFKETLSLLKDIKPDYVNVSRFAKREGTPASKLKQLNTKEMKRRTRMCSDLVKNLRKGVNSFKTI